MSFLSRLATCENGNRAAGGLTSQICTPIKIFYLSFRKRHALLDTLKRMSKPSIRRPGRKRDTADVREKGMGPPVAVSLANLWGKKFLPTGSFFPCF